jgi:hypothetical protein
MEELCMSNRPSGSLTSTDSLMTVRFITDGSGVEKGFAATYKMGKQTDSSQDLLKFVC